MGVPFELPMGILKSGEVERRISLNETTGRTRKEISKPAVRKNGGKIVSTILANCIEEVGGVPVTTADRSKLIQQMVAGDRNFCLLMISKISQGDVIHAKMSCSNCETTLDTDLPIDDIEVHRVEKSEYEEEGNNRRFSIDLPEHGLTAAFRYPTGMDEEAIAVIMASNPVEANYEMYRRCCIELNGKTAPISKSDIEDMSSRKLDALEEAFQNKQPGPRMLHYVECDSCAYETPIDLRRSDFLFSRPAMRRSS